MDYFDLLRYRKSIRKFTDEQISQKDLTNILIAANSAPVGSNLYKDIHLTVVQNRGILNKLAEAAVKRWGDKAEVKKIIADMPASEFGQGKYDPFYNAPTVIFVSHRKQNIQPGIEFSNVACITYSMHLAAANLGLGSVLMWFALESMREIPEFDNTSVLSLPADFEPLLGIAIGHSEKELIPRDLTADRITVNYLK